MVVICDKEYTNSNFAKHFEAYPFELSDFQKHAIQGIVEGNHVLVTAHTGSGKTLPAEFAIEHFHSKGKKVIYTSPIKALSNQKYYEFTKQFPNISFGMPVLKSIDRYAKKPLDVHLMIVNPEKYVETGRQN